MTAYVPTPAPVLNPKWTGRNRSISKYIEPDSAILDLGCGAKDLLNYTNPKSYIGVDYYTNEYADIKLDLNTDFVLPKGNWDYIVCSGVIEYLKDVDHFFSYIKNISKYIIVTYWTGAISIENKDVIKTVDEFDAIFRKHFQVLKIEQWTSHYIYIGNNRDI